MPVDNKFISTTHLTPSTTFNHQSWVRCYMVIVQKETFRRIKEPTIPTTWIIWQFKYSMSTPKSKHSKLEFSRFLKERPGPVIAVRVSTHASLPHWSFIYTSWCSCRPNRMGIKFLTWATSSSSWLSECSWLWRTIRKNNIHRIRQHNTWENCIIKFYEVAFNTHLI